jgi:uncharacterized protein YjbI with pentapeptide repeats
MISPIRAPVRPRVLSPVTGIALLLEEEIRQLQEAGCYGGVQLVGPVGSGKTTALHHLAAVFRGEPGLVLMDEPESLHQVWALQDNLVVYASAKKPPAANLQTYQLAPWGRDELIEYLLGYGKTLCASVVARLPPEDCDMFGGRPDVWQAVLTTLARDAAIPNAVAALHCYVEAQLPDTDLLERARSACLNLLTADNSSDPAWEKQAGKPGFPESLTRLLRHREIQLLLATERVVEDVRGEADCDFLALRLPRALVRAAAEDLADDPRALDHLKKLLAGPVWSHAMAASLLHAVDRCWVPMITSTPNLAGAYLDEARWQGVQLAQANLKLADLSNADLRGANLDGVVALKTDLSAARLSGASMKGIQLGNGQLPFADLTAVRAEDGLFECANLEGAALEDAWLKGASFWKANLRKADFRGAMLARATFDGAEIEDADFSGANLEAASLIGQRLRTATFVGARFARAELVDCDLEYMNLPGANFEGADLGEALLTGSSIVEGCFTKACLRRAKLADINWEGACLRDADLREATFHMGSSRSGLVNSPIACEGSRTGFYTDDYEEQFFKAPEEIRKANLCGADLRGARLDNVDFYLVDLRGALYDAEQEKHLRSCRAILETRV